MKTEDITLNLAQFKGSESFHLINDKISFYLTEGCFYVRTNCAAQWLFDLIVSYQKQLKNQPFQIWELRQSRDHSWKVKCTDGDGNFLIEEQIEFSHFPLPHFTMWVIDQICMLPSEY